MALTAEHQRAIDLMRQAQNTTDENQANALISQAQQAAQNSGANASQVFAAVTNHAQEIQARNVSLRPKTPETGGGGGGGGSNTTAVDPAAAAEKERRKQLGNTLRAYFKSIGLGALSDWAVGKAADGFTQEYIELEMRNQPAYKQRFPAMQSFIDDSIPFTEAEYMEYEQAAQSLDQRYGLPGNMIYNAVTDLLTNRVDAEELSDRAAMAGAAAMQAPEDFKTTMRNYYGIDEGGLAGYFLDPDNVVDSLKKQSAASLSGTIAGRQGIANLPKDLAEDLYDRGVREESQMVEGFSQANQLRGLSSGKANTASQEQLIRGSFGDSAAQEAVAKVQRIRRASNRGGGGYVGGESGASGLGSASY